MRLVLRIAVALLILLPFTQSNDERILHFLGWTEYVPHSAIESFSRKSGVKVVTGNFNFNEGMLAMLRAKLAQNIRTSLTPP